MNFILLITIEMDQLQIFTNYISKRKPDKGNNRWIMSIIYNNMCKNQALIKEIKNVNNQVSRLDNRVNVLENTVSVQKKVVKHLIENLDVEKHNFNHKIKKIQNELRVLSTQKLRYDITIDFLILLISIWISRTFIVRMPLNVVYGILKKRILGDYRSLKSLIGVINFLMIDYKIRSVVGDYGIYDNTWYRQLK